MSEDSSTVILIGSGIVIIATIWAMLSKDYLPGWLKLGIIGSEIVIAGWLLHQYG